jgi:hypothetical protein
MQDREVILAEGGRDIHRGSPRQAWTLTPDWYTINIQLR